MIDIFHVFMDLSQTEMTKEQFKKRLISRRVDLIPASLDDTIKGYLIMCLEEQEIDEILETIKTSKDLMTIGGQQIALIDDTNIEVSCIGITTVG